MEGGGLEMGGEGVGWGFDDRDIFAGLHLLLYDLLRILILIF